MIPVLIVGRVMAMYGLGYIDDQGKLPRRVDCLDSSVGAIADFTAYPAAMQTEA